MDEAAVHPDPGGEIFEPSPCLTTTDVVDAANERMPGGGGAASPALPPAAPPSAPGGGAVHGLAALPSVPEQPAPHGFPRSMNWREHITVDPHVCHGKGCVRDTRVPVSVVLDNLAAGLSTEEVTRSYPSISSEAVRAALAYAADLAGERVVAVPA